MANRIGPDGHNTTALIGLQPRHGMPSKRKRECLMQNYGSCKENNSATFISSKNQAVAVLKIDNTEKLIGRIPLQATDFWL